MDAESGPVDPAQLASVRKNMNQRLAGLRRFKQRVATGSGVAQARSDSND